MLEGGLRGVTRLGRGVTPAGWALAGLSVTGLLLGARYSWSEFSVLGLVSGILWGLGLVGVLMPKRASTTLQLRPTRVTVGQATDVSIEVRAGWSPWVAPVCVLPVGADRLTLRLPTARAGHPSRATTELPTSRRGVFPVGPVVHVRSDLLGLFRRERRAGHPQTLHVRPRVVSVPSVSAGIVHDLEGVASEQLTASDLSFHALREYVPGDDPRHVHWKSTARAGSLLVRQFQLTRRSHATVMLDPQLPSYDGRAEFELAVSVATSLALRAALDDYEVTLACGAFGLTTRDQSAMLDLACRFERGAGSLQEMGARTAVEVGGTGLVVVVSGSRADDGAVRQVVSHFPSSAGVIAVRADSSGRPRASRTPNMGSVVLSDLDQLPALLARAWQ